MLAVAESVVEIVPVWVVMPRPMLIKIAVSFISANLSRVEHSLCLRRMRDGEDNEVGFWQGIIEF